MISCVPSDLVAAAKCFTCIPKAARKWVRTYLLCQYANKTGNNIALVGSNFGGNSSAQGAAITYNLGGGSVTSGNTVIVGVALAGLGLNNFDVTQLTKSAGTASIGAVILDSNKNEGAGDIQCAIFRVPVTASGTLTLRYANGVNAFMLLAAAEFTGLNSAPLGISDSLFGNAATETSNSIATTAPGMIFYIATEDSTLPWARTWSDTLVFNNQNPLATLTGLVQFKLVNSSPNVLTSTVEAAGITWLTCSQAYKSS